nr:retrovirus-related Pol polyprotein from transposon TNT 1-94 [Tanacetum cinerariifolium]
MAVGDSDDALVCCVENTVEDRIMDSGASFHATYCKEELDRFRLRSSKVHFTNDKILYIVGIGDVFLKTSFGTSWTLKDVRYILGLKRRLILAGQLDKEGYHVGFRDQQWKVTKGSLVVAHGNKRGSLYMVEVHPEGIGATINGSGNAAVWFGKAKESFLHNVRKDKETAETAAGVVVGIMQTFRARSATNSSSLTKPIQKSQVVLVDILENLAENDSIFAEHGLSSEITQSPCGSSDISEGFENSGSFKDSERSYEE